jgi:hypothetical protein
VTYVQTQQPGPSQGEKSGQNCVDSSSDVFTDPFAGQER